MNTAGEQSLQFANVLHRGGIFVRTQLPCGCLFDWYMGGRGYYRGGCADHEPGQAVYICPSNGCGKQLPTLKDLKEHRRVHAF